MKTSTIQITVHEIATDGLPEMSTFDSPYVGRVAFIFDGCIVSGWPMSGDEDGPAKVDDAGRVLWEGNHDVSHTRLFAGVTHWVEFPVPVWELER